MNIKKVSLGAFVAAGVFLGSSRAALAVDPVIAQTWVSGTVYDESSNPVSGGSVTVYCAAESQTVPIGADGSYGATFSQSDCKVGDTASAVATTSEGSGTNSGVVQNTAVNGPVVDLDIAVLDITVPEFGQIAGVLTAVGSAGSYLVYKLKRAA